MAALLRGHVAVLCVAVLIAVGNGGWACGAVHHVIGGDQGWDAVSDGSALSAERIFRVGDNIWFAQSAATEGSIAELRSREEFDACDLTNPIRMYTDDAHRVSLDGEGPRYFASSAPDSCRGGLKLHVQVLPRAAAGERTVVALGGAAGPQPSGSARLEAMWFVMWIGVSLLFCCIGF